MKVLTFFGSFVSVLSLAQAVAVGRPGRAENLIANGDFEKLEFTDATTQTANWVHTGLHSGFYRDKGYGSVSQILGDSEGSSISQEVMRGLVPGHSYHVTFVALQTQGINGPPDWKCTLDVILGDASQTLSFDDTEKWRTYNLRLTPQVDHGELKFVGTCYPYQYVVLDEVSLTA